MTDTPQDDRDPIVRALTGHPISRRDVLKAAGLTSVAIVGSSVARRALAQGDTAAAAPSTLTAADVAARLGSDPESIFRFVSEDVRYEPYAGALRGARGAFASRAGNSVDQADLLAVLLQAAGVETRYAFGQINDDTAAQLLASSIADADIVGLDTTAAIAGVLPGETAVASELSPDQRERFARASADAERINAWLRDEIVETADTIKAAIEASGSSLDGDFTPIPGREVSEHVWIQARIDGSDWIDLEPSVPGLGMGDAATVADKTADAIPDDLYHYVELGVVGEKTDGDALRTEELIGIRGRASDWAGKPILLSTPEGSQLAAGALASVAGLRQYIPVITVGTESFQGGMIEFASGDGGDGGGLGGGFFETETLPEETTAAWMTATVIGPDREPATIRRTLFDRFGEEARIADPLEPASLPAAEIVDLGGDVGEQVLAAMATLWLTVSTGLPGRTSEVLGLEEGDPAVPAALAFAHQLADDVMGKHLTTGLGVRTFVDAPNITALDGRPALDAGGGPTMELALDILHRSRGSVPVDGADAPLPPPAIAGIAAHVAERFIAGGGRPVVAEEGSTSVSVSRVFAEAKKAGMPLRAASSPEDLEDLLMEEPARARLAARLHEGLVAVVPMQSVTIDGAPRSGWWLIDPASGRVVDEMDDGRGSDSTEESGELIIAEKTVIVGACLTAIIVFGFAAALAVFVFYVHVRNGGALSGDLIAALGAQMEPFAGAIAMACRPQ